MKLRKFISLLGVCCLSLAFLSACSEAKYASHVVKKIPLPQDAPSKSKGTFKVGNEYSIQGKRYRPNETYNYTEVGVASWYGPGFHGKKTANGEIFDTNELTAAHRTLQMPSIIKVTNLENGRSAVLRVNDRGPYAHNRVLDVSERAAILLGFKNKGMARIKIEVLVDASKEVASLAKTGKSTKGYEVAFAGESNNTYSVASNAMTEGVSAPVPVAKPVVIANRQIAANTPMQPPSVPQVISQETFTNTQIVKRDAVANIGNVYVQAGSFSQEGNALNFSNQLSKFGPSQVYMTQVNDQPYFRVRLGPYQTDDEAQQIVMALNQAGTQNVVIIRD